MQKLIHLHLYGEIDHEGEMGKMAWNLYQSEAMTRLRDVSLSSVPSRFSPHSMAASRFEHSVGVGYLARKLSDWRKPLEDYKFTLLAAALLHDIGSPPFSHISEMFLWDLTGNTHEEETGRLLRSGGQLATILDSFDVDPQEVREAINGKNNPLGSLVAGSVDLDNIDNSIHLLQSLGYADRVQYDPLKLIKAFRIRDKEVYLDSRYVSELIGWQDSRKALYDILYLEPNLSAASMLYRALEYAYAGGYLDKDFFRMGESDALHHLLNHSGRQSVRILERALTWKHYPRVWNFSSLEEDKRLVPLYDNWKARKAFADRLADDFGIRSTSLAIYVSRARGEKNIDLPFQGQKATAAAKMFTNTPGSQRFSIFVERGQAQKLLRAPKSLEKIVERALADLPEAEEGAHPHVFF